MENQQSEVKTNDGIKIKANLLSGAINSGHRMVSWNNNIIAFGCHNQIHLVNSETRRTFATLNGHSDRVTCVRMESDVIVSGGCDKRVLIHTNPNDLLSHSSWIISHCKSLNGVIGSLFVTSYEKDILLIIASCHNGDIVLFSYSKGNNELKEIGTLSFGKNIQEALTAQRLGNIMLCAFAGFDFSLHIYSFPISQFSKLKSEEGIELNFHFSLKGHENSINELSFTPLDNGISAVLASCSKDSSIRLWEFGISINFLEKALVSVPLPNSNEFLFCNLESILAGHQDSVSSVIWGKRVENAPLSLPNLTLLSSSFDFSLMFWERDDSDLWISRYRLGQMSGNKNAFYGAIFSPCGNFILAYTYGGSFNLHTRTLDSLTNTFSFDSTHFISGHAGPVADLKFSSNHKFLFSGSKDQTSRIFASSYSTGNWHEIARPQIHGYDINAVDCLAVRSPYGAEVVDLLVCGADEKIVRLFEAPASFVNSINSFTSSSLHLYFNTLEEEKACLQVDGPSFVYATSTEGGAQVLGLMTKAFKCERPKYTEYFEEEEEEEDGETEELVNKEISIDSNRPPIEEILGKSTLWPELNKLYGHGFEIKALATTHDGSLIASSCKSQTNEHSAIILFNPSTFQIEQKLYGHSFTPLRLEFSNNDELLASVSRDRSFCLFGKKEGKYQLIFQEKSHARMVWAVAFSSDDKLIATGSRDKLVKVWRVSNEEVEFAFEYKFSFGVNSLSFASTSSSQNTLLSVGGENGEIIITSVTPSGIKQLASIPHSIGHCATVNRLHFQRNLSKKGNVEVLASCGDDHSVRIFEIEFN